MAKKIIKNRAFWPATILAMFCLMIWSHYFLMDKAKADTISDVQVTVTGNAPSITWLTGFHNDVDVTIPEWAAGAGFYQASTTFRVTDTNGWTDISTTTLFVFRSGKDWTSTNCSSTNDLDYRWCYPATSTESDWDPYGGTYPNYDDGAVCTLFATSTNSADFWCTTTLYYVADATDLANEGYNYSAQWWQAYASTSDKGGLKAVSSRYASDLLDVTTNRAIAIDSTSINYSNLTTLTAGSDTGFDWGTTTVTTTGNIVADVHFSGGHLRKSDDYNVRILAYNQRFTTTSPADFGAAGTFQLPTSTDISGNLGESHDLFMRRPTTTSPGNGVQNLCADKIYWGINIPSLTLAGTYASTTDLTATSTVSTINDG